jgi:hypothetical protein
MRSCWTLQTTGFHICKKKTIDKCTWNPSLKFIEVRMFCYLMPVIGKNMISWFYTYVEHSEIKTKTVNISPKMSKSVLPYSLKSPRNSECKLAHIYGSRTIYHTLHVFNVLSTFKHYFTQNMMFSSVNTYNFHTNVKKISVNLLFRQRVMASMIFTHRDNPKLLTDHVLTIFRSSCGMGGI